MDYTTMTLLQLREEAKKLKVKGASTMKKQELIDVLKEGNKVEGIPSYSSRKANTEHKVEEQAPQYVRGTRERQQKEIGKGAAEGTDRVLKPMGEKSTRESADKFAKDTRRQPVEATERGEEKKPQPYRGEVFTAQEFFASDVPELRELYSGKIADGILEVMEGCGFIRCANYLTGEGDIYVSLYSIRKFNLKTGDHIIGGVRIKSNTEKFSALLFMESVNGEDPLNLLKRRPFEDLTPIFPQEKIILGNESSAVPMRMVDMIAPIGKGQRGMIVSPPKAGKTTLLKQIAKSISTNYPDIYLIVLLIDERPEEVTDIRESIEGENVEVIYSTFDELPEHHRRVSEMVLERAKRLVEYKKDVVVLLDSITRLARAYNLLVPPSGRTLTGGLDPAALHMPKKFFGAARNIRQGGSLTILATALVETGSKMDDVIFEEFKGTGNMELVLSRKISEKRIFPALDVMKSSTRRDDLLLNKEEQEAMYLVRKEMSLGKTEEVIEDVLKLFSYTKTNKEFVEYIGRTLKK